MKILIFGAGSIGRRHLTNLVACGYRDITHCDPSEAALARAKESAPFIHITTNPDEALQRARYEAVFICAPPHTHLPQLAAAIEHGAHVFVEKPFALASEGIEPVLQRAKQAGLTIMTAFNMRYLELVRQMKDWADAGRIGNILACRIGLSSYMPAWHPGEDYRQNFMANWATGGGALFDYVHGIDLAQWLAGEIDSVACLQRTTSLHMETDDVAALSCTTVSGAVLSLYFDFIDRVPRKSIDLIGSEGTMIWQYDTQETLTLHGAGSREHTRILTKENYAQCYIREIEDFFACIQSGRTPQADGWTGLSTQQVLDMALTSNRTGVIVRR